MATWYDTIQVFEIPNTNPVQYKRVNCVIDQDQVIYCAEFINTQLELTKYTMVHLHSDATAAMVPLVIDIDYHAFRALL